MLSSGFALYNNVINVNFHSSANQRLKIFRHQPLVSSTSILESEWHNFVTVQLLLCNKGYLLLIRLEHKDLVVSEEDV